jgi:hypothetical protein
VGGAGVEKGRNGDGAETNDHLHRVAGAHTGNGEQRDARLLWCVRVVVVIPIMKLEAEQLGADTIMAPDVFFVTVEALAIASSFVDLVWREAADDAARDCDRVGRGCGWAMGRTGRRWCGAWRRRGQGERRGRRRQEAARRRRPDSARVLGRSGLLSGRLLPALMGAGEAHRHLQRLRPLELDIDAEGVLKARDEQLDLLGFG